MSKSSKDSAKSARSLEETIGAMAAQLDSINSQLRDTNSRFDKLEAMFAASQKENADLKELVKNKDDEILQLKTRVNAVEQHNRSCCVRVFGLSIDGEESDSLSVMSTLYNKLYLPILEGAVHRKRLPSIPPLHQLIQTAHVLPGKDNKPKPILCRFFSSHIKTLIMQLKKDFAPRATSTLAPSPSFSSTNKLPPLLYPVYDDLTRDAFRLMRAISSHKEVQSCWSVGGSIKFRIIDSAVIKSVRSIYDTVDNIISQ